MKVKINKTVLCIVDGLGINSNSHGNAVVAADMKNFNAAAAEFPYTTLKASGAEVGLLDEKDAGNSEIGHNAIGSGQHIKQGLALLNEKFSSGEIWQSPAWEKLAANAKKSKLNVIFLLSDGRLHSDLPHLFALLKECGRQGIEVSIHALLDGRDVPTQSALDYIEKTYAEIKKTGASARIATVAGRGVLFMDRYESNPNMLTSAFEVCVSGKAPHIKEIADAIRQEYKNRPGMTDETMPPFILDSAGLIKNGDSVLLLNYRGDRAVETCAMFEHGKFLTAEQFKKINKCLFAGVLQYDAEAAIPKNFLCPPSKITDTLTEWLCEHEVRQYTVAETVKYGHMTYFFNGNRAAPINSSLETWREIKSDVTEYDRAPLMKASEITADALAAIESNKYDFIKLNIANPDMVGHTANFNATVKACRAVDDCLGKLINICKRAKINLVITGDHGNAEEMLYPDGRPRSSHTNNVVPFVILPFAGGDIKIKGGSFGLTNIAATICKLLGISPNKKFNPPIF